LVPEGYSATEDFVVKVGLEAVALFLQVFILYLYYGLIPTLVWIGYRVFRKQNNPLNSLTIN